MGVICVWIYNPNATVGGVEEIKKAYKWQLFAVCGPNCGPFFIRFLLFPLMPSPLMPSPQAMLGKRCAWIP